LKLIKGTAGKNLIPAPPGGAGGKEEGKEGYWIKETGGAPNPCAMPSERYKNVCLSRGEGVLAKCRHKGKLNGPKKLL